MLWMGDTQFTPQLGQWANWAVSRAPIGQGGFGLAMIRLRRTVLASAYTDCKKYDESRREYWPTGAQKHFNALDTDLSFAID